MTAWRLTGFSRVPIVQELSPKRNIHLPREIQSVNYVQLFRSCGFKTKVGLYPLSRESFAYFISIRASAKVRGTCGFVISYS